MFQTEVVQKIKTHILISILFFFENHTVRVMWKTCCTAGQATDDNIIWRMRIACWIPNATDTHSQYVILIVFPPQQWLHERASLLRCTHIGCLFLKPVPFYFISKSSVRVVSVESLHVSAVGLGVLLSSSGDIQ
jgi:hypothetical protein